MEPVTTVTRHHLDECSDASPPREVITRTGTPKEGGAHSTYLITVGPQNWDQYVGRLEFQTVKAPNKGVTNEVLLAVVEDRLKDFQAGAFPCEENATALDHIGKALDALKSRTVRRLKQGTEGTLVENEPYTPPVPEVQPASSSEEGAKEVPGETGEKTAETKEPEKTEDVPPAPEKQADTPPAPTAVT